MNLLKSTYVFSFYTLISRILGYLRDILIAATLGASVFADAFFVAFRLPNTFRRLFSEGTFNAAFVPSYSSEIAKNEKSGKKFANEIFTLLTIILLAIILLGEIFTPFLVYLIAPGFFSDPDKFNFAVQLTRITFPFLLFVSLSSFFSAILNTHNKFAAAAAAPIILNVVLIISLIISYLYKFDYAINLSYAVSISGFIQLLFLIFFSKNFYKPSFSLKSYFNKKVKFFFKKLLPSIFSSGITQINIFIGTIIASFQAGAVSYLYYADRIYQINLAIAGIAVSTVSLPALTKAIKKNFLSEINKIQNKSFEISLLFSLPASFGLIIGSEEIVNALFGYGSFTKGDIVLTAQALKIFGFGIPAFALIKVMSNLFFARDDTKTPFYISLIIVTVNLFISLIFFREIGFIIIPIATSISTWVGVFIYFILFSRFNFIKFENLFFLNFIKILVTTLIMSFLLYFLLEYFKDFLTYTNSYKLLILIIIISFAATFYMLICYFLGLLKYKNFKA
tara:strand:- start:1957 stop:3480 length:1524 start_codon:yes stop_codon:yes gene_type:complete